MVTPELLGRNLGAEAPVRALLEDGELGSKARSKGMWRQRMDLQPGW